MSNKTLEGRIYAALVAAAQGETNLLDLASDLANGIKHQVHLELEMLEESAREREAVKFEIGVHVGITDTKYEGMKGVIVAGNPSYWEVEIPGITHPVHFKPESLKPFPKAQQPQPEPPAPPAFAVGTRVRVTRSNFKGEVGEITKIPDDSKDYVYVSMAGYQNAYLFQTYELEPLPSEPGAPAGALPAGVTREWSWPPDTFERACLTVPTDILTIDVNSNDEGYVRSELMISSDSQRSSLSTVMDLDGLLALQTWVGQAIDYAKSKSEANNGLH